MSLLLDHGHQHARFYPVGMVWEEAQIVVDRINQQEASRTTLMQLAYLGSKTKKGAQALRKTVEKLTNG